MAHFKTNSKLEKTTPVEWLGVGSNIGRLVNSWSRRSDLVAYVGMSAGVDRGAPALFDPASAEVEVNVPIAFGFTTPEQVGDMQERSQQFEFPKATGAIFHEAMHARFSTWDLEKAARELPENVNEAIHLLEESRIEARGVTIMPENKSFLRACALEIVLADIQEEEELAKLSTTRQVAKLLGLTYARVDAGVLEYSDIAPIRELIEKLVPSEFIGKLSVIWREFQTLHATNEERMYELAYEWEELVKEREDETGETEAQQKMEQFLSQVADAIAESMSKAEIGAMEDAQNQQTKEEYEQTVEEVNNKSKEQRAHRDEASKVFGRNSTPSDAGSSSRLAERRQPTAEERISAVKIAQALEKAKYRDRIRIESASTTPPGRLRTRSLVQGEAYRERGIMHEVQPFQRVQRKHTDDPNLTIGVMVDISGSMGSAMQPMASAAWVLSEAVRRVQGKVAMVYYGEGVFPTLKAGQHLDKVNVYTASDATEEFDKAFKALDGELNLLHGSGARLLVIVSDGQYTSTQKEKAKTWIKSCGQSGVGVLWIGAGHYGERAERYCNGKESVYARMEGSVTASVDMIGRAATKALTNAGEVRNS